MATGSGAPGTEYRAEAEASSPSPQDWGRALQVVLQDLAEQAERDGRGPAGEALLGADVTLHLDGIQDGVRITGTWRAADAQSAG